MVAPHGAYTPKSGILAGQTFSSYSRYQQARSRALGFTSYSQERAAKLDPVFSAVQERARAKGYTRNRAIQTAQSLGARQGRGRPAHDLISRILRTTDLFETGAEAAEELYGSQSE